ncbi:M16 family metallopeptidase [Christiangramia sp. LLG6405-1]|uniref:M16 family metallopeptidase n=1 Tax=Christiangramia sp. LLG6405-1 TaxID=3160832 RepID=UPI003870196E
MKFQTTLITLCLLLSSIWVQSQPVVQDTITETFNLDPTVRYGKLDNGFTYYIKDNDSETTELRLVVKAGILHQNENQLEYAHLLEHMGYKEPKHFPQKLKYFKTAGRGIHAQTSSFFTLYYAWIPSKDKVGINNGLQLVRDWAKDIVLDQESIDVERNAVLGESRSQNPHRKWAMDTIKNILIDNTGLSINSHAERNKSMNNFDRQSFLDFYEDWYRPDLQAAIIVGNVEVDSVEKQVKNLFSDLKIPKRIRDADKIIKAEIATLPSENQIIYLKDTIQSELRLSVLSKVLNNKYSVKNGSDFKNKLLQELYEIIVGTRAKRIKEQYAPPFVNFTPNFKAGGLGHGQLYASIMNVDFENSDSRNMEKDFKSGLLAWRQLHENYSTSELADAKDQLRIQYSKEDTKNSRILAGRYTAHFVYGNAALNPEMEREMIFGLLDQIDLTATQQFAAGIGDLQKNSDYIFFSGNQTQIPKQEILKKWISEVQETQIGSIKDPLKEISSLDSLFPLSNKIRGLNFEQSESILDVVTINLENGIQFILKPATPVSDIFEKKVSIRAFRPNPVSIQKRFNYLSAVSVPEALQYLGAGPYDSFQLEKFKQDHKLKIRYETNKDVQSIDGDAPANKIGELLNLIHLYAKEPRKDTLAFNVWKKNQIKDLKGNSVRGSSEFFMDKIEALWYPMVPVLSSDFLNQLTIEEIFNSHDKWYSNFNDFTFIVTGDFDIETIKPILLEKLAGLPISSDSKNNKAKYKFPLKTKDEIIRYRNLNQVYVHLYLPVKIEKDAKTQILLQLISRVLNQREHARLRDGSYAPGAWGTMVDPENAIFSFKIYFDSKLGDEERMIRMALEEMRELREKGIDQETFDRIIIDERLAFEKQINTYGYFDFWSDFLQEAILNKNNGEKIILSYESILNHFISLDDFNAALKMYLTEDNLQKFKVIPYWYQN